MPMLRTRPNWPYRIPWQVLVVVAVFCLGAGFLLGLVFGILQSTK
jgi:hypothetical protein